MSEQRNMTSLATQYRFTVAPNPAVPCLFCPRHLLVDHPLLSLLTTQQPDHCQANVGTPVALRFKRARERYPIPATTHVADFFS